MPYNGYQRRKVETKKKRVDARRERTLKLIAKREAAEEAEKARAIAKALEEKAKEEEVKLRALREEIRRKAEEKAAGARGPLTEERAAPQRAGPMAAQGQAPQAQPAAGQPAQGSKVDLKAVFKKMHEDAEAAKTRRRGKESDVWKPLDEPVQKTKSRHGRYGNII